MQKVQNDYKLYLATHVYAEPEVHYHDHTRPLRDVRLLIFHCRQQASLDDWVYHHGESLMSRSTSGTCWATNYCSTTNLRGRCSFFSRHRWYTYMLLIPQKRHRF